MASSARPLRLPPSVQAPPHLRPHPRPSRAIARPVDAPSADWLEASFPRRDRGVHLSTPVVTAVAVNLLLGAFVLTWLLPSPWGGVVPALVLAQLVGWRHGAPAAVWGLTLGAGLGSLLGPLLGLGDWRRSALALLFVLLPAMLAWPARRNSVAR